MYTLVKNIYRKLLYVELVTLHLDRSCIASTIYIMTGKFNVDYLNEFKNIVAYVLL